MICQCGAAALAMHSLKLDLRGMVGIEQLLEGTWKVK
jgi:hypothetical protein